MFRETKELPTTETKPENNCQRAARAMRVGCIMAPKKLMVRLYDGNDSACAIGAIALGAGIIPMGVPYLDAQWIYDKVREVFGFSKRFMEKIWSQNDSTLDYYSREVIADWLEHQGEEK